MRTFPLPRGHRPANPIAPFVAPFARVVVALLLAVVAPTGAVFADELQDVSKLVSSGKLDEGEKRADAFLAKTPKDAQMRFLKGVILAQRGKRDEAVALFTTITQDFPELPEPYNNMAVIYAAQGQYDKARDALETAVRVSPNYATAFENLGDVYAALAAKSYQEARRHDTGNAAALRKLDATRALLGVSSSPVAAADATPAPVTGAAAAPPSSEAVRSQRNIGLPSPAGPRVTVGGQGATAPEIVVPATTAALPQGSNVVAIEEPGSATNAADTSTLSGARTAIAVDPAQPVADVTTAVRRWAADRSVTADDLKIRIDGDSAVARFRETAKNARKPTTTSRMLTLRRNGASWVVTDARTGS